MGGVLKNVTTAFRIAVLNSIISDMTQNHPQKAEKTVQYDCEQDNTAYICPIHTSRASGYR